MENLKERAVFLTRNNGFYLYMPHVARSCEETIDDTVSLIMMTVRHGVVLFSHSCFLNDPVRVHGLDIPV